MNCATFESNSDHHQCKDVLRRRVGRISGDFSCDSTKTMTMPPVKMGKATTPLQWAMLSLLLLLVSAGRNVALGGRISSCHNVNYGKTINFFLFF